MQNIIIEPFDMWKYFRQHKEELKTTVHTVAENDDYGVEITITEEHDMPLFVVTADDYQYAEERATSEADCKKIVEELYDKYLTEKFLEDECYEEESLLDQEDMISERETELDDAIILLLDAIMEDDSTVVLQSNGVDLDALCDDLKDHILEYLARKHRMESIRRPMVLEDDETKEDFFTEYPYECMVYEDKDNPIYKK